MPRFERYNDYLAVAAKRLADARELLAWPSVDAGGTDAGRRHLDAVVYLSGYVIECALKAYLIAMAGGHRDNLTFDEALACLVARQGLSERDRTYVARHSHELRTLVEASDLQARLGSRDLARLETCLKWRPAWRYSPRQCRTRREANRWMNAIERVYRRLGAVHGERIGGDECGN